MINTEYPGFVKDDTPGRARAILNIDNASFNAYKQARAKDLALAAITDEVTTLRQDINDIKNLLIQLTGKQ